jgi:hypothetical protein
MWVEGITRSLGRAVVLLSLIVSVKFCCQESELRASQEVGSLDPIGPADLGLQWNAQPRMHDDGTTVRPPQVRWEEGAFLAAKH